MSRDFKQDTGKYINPTLQFISTEAATPPALPRTEPKATETKSKRMQILIRPSSYEGLKKRAKKLGGSMNEIINEAIEKYLREVR